ncbi:MAG: DoxX family protein [Micromonosporaceae bacterium]
MTATDTSQSTITSSTRTPGRAWNITLWVLQALVAAFFVFAGGIKLAGDPTAVQAFDTIGLGQWFRYFTGAVEIAGGIGLLIPRLMGLAALGLVAVLVGAIITEFSIGGSPTNPVPFLLVVGLIAYGRRGAVTALTKRRGSD